MHQNGFVLGGPGDYFKVFCGSKGSRDRLGCRTKRALLGAILDRPGRQLGAKLVRKRAPEAHINDLKNWVPFGYPLAFFFGFSLLLGANFGPCWHPKTIKK